MRIVSLLMLLLLMSCRSDQKAQETRTTEPAATKTDIISTEGMTVTTRFNPPQAYLRVPEEDNSYANYLRSLQLKKHSAIVNHYDGSTKPNRNVYTAVVDLPIGDKDLHQCADAIMRLRAEYLWNEERYDDIHFNFTNGFRCDYSKWMQGYRIKVNGNKTEWILTSTPSNDYDSFWSYMELIFMYAGTASLSQELKAVDISTMEIGDVLIKGGYPGHAVIVIDMVYNTDTREKLYMLGQSYMPAQEIQILNNNNDTSLSPWYRLDSNIAYVKTPEWTFSIDQIMRFE